MYHAIVETDMGEIFNLLRSDSTIGGNSLVSFYTALSLFCLGEADQIVQQWFSNLEVYFHEPICEMCRPFLQSCYSGDWDYHEEEYQIFCRRSKIPLTEEEFKENLKQVNETWVDIQLLFKNVSKLKEVLVKANLEKTSWYTPGYTESDFEAITQTLMLARERFAKKIRLKII